MATDPVIEQHDRSLVRNYPRFPVTMVAGQGCTLTDAEGGQYLDMFSGFGAGVLGHCHPEIVQAATDQAQRLWHVGNLLHTEPQTRLAERIARLGLGGRSYFCHSGSDANEAAFKLARLYGEGRRHKVIATENSFHGRGFAAMMATGQPRARAGFEPFLPGFQHVPYNDLDAMARAVDGETVAIIVEPILGEGGVYVPDEAYVTGLRELCDRHDLLLIFDEVWTGCGRTGAMFGYQHWPVRPDIMTLGKAVGCGLPVGVMHAEPRVADRFDHASYGGVPHATTLGGNCVSMAVSATLFDVLEREDLPQWAGRLGSRLHERLRRWAESTPRVREVRGRGLFIGIELDPDAPGAWFDKATDVVRRCLDRGVVVGRAQERVVRLAPPLIMSEAEGDRGLEILEDVVAGG